MHTGECVSYRLPAHHCLWGLKKGSQGKTKPKTNKIKCFPAFGWNRISSERLEDSRSPAASRATCSGRALALNKEGVYCVLPQKLYKKGSNVNSKRKTNQVPTPTAARCAVKDLQKESRRKRLGPRSLPRLVYKKWGLCPLFPPHEKHENRGAEQRA